MWSSTPTEFGNVVCLNENKTKNGRFCGTGNPSPTVIRNAVAQLGMQRKFGSFHPSTIAMVPLPLKWDAFSYGKLGLRNGNG